MNQGNIIEIPDLRNRVSVFRDRQHAGEVLAGLLVDFARRSTIVLRIPAGGVPVAAIIAGRLELSLDVAVVSKITLPWNSEVGYGAVAFDGTVLLNEAVMMRSGLNEREVDVGIEKTKDKVACRVERFRAKRPFPDLAEQTSILVDDGLASGFTMRVAVDALRNLGAARVVIAVPTAHDSAVGKLASEVEALYCANVRGGARFAVADAYERWSDVEETDVERTLEWHRVQRDG